MITHDFSKALRGLDRFRTTALDGARDGLAGSAAGITLEMRQTDAHGDQTGASKANYTAYVVGRGADGSTELARSRAAAAAFNPDHVGPTSTVEVDGLGVIMTDNMDYAEDRETANAGEKAVLGPTIEASGERLTRAAAEGSRRALS